MTLFSQAREQFYMLKNGQIKVECESNAHKTVACKVYIEIKFVRT